MSDDQTADERSDREEAADAVRARLSLEGEADPGGEDLTAPAFTSGERSVLGDFEMTDADEALDDDDVPNEE
jgi:hypothetical protein